MRSVYRNVKRVREVTQAVILMYSCGFPSGVRRRVLKSGKYSPRKTLSRERCIANAVWPYRPIHLLNVHVSRFDRLTPTSEIS
jgi:hypothetical protein